MKARLVKAIRRKQLAALEKAQREVAADFAAAFPLGDVARHMTCFEVEAAVSLLRGYGQTETAQQLVQDHAEADQHGDVHHECTEECQ